VTKVVSALAGQPLVESKVCSAEDRVESLLASSIKVVTVSNV